MRGWTCVEVIAAQWHQGLQAGPDGVGFGVRLVPVGVAGAGALGIDQALYVGVILNPGVAVPAAAVTRQLGGAVENAHPVLVGPHRQRAPHMGVRYRIVVGVEPHAGRLANLCCYGLAQGEGRLGQRHQAAALGLEGLAHA